MAKIGVIGWGFVGKATGEGFLKNSKNKVFWYDKYKKSPFTQDEVIKNSDFIFICLPTPMIRDYSGMDLSIVKKVVNDVAKKINHPKKIIIIKSTVIPGTTESFVKKYPKVNFAMNPEFLTQRNAKSDFLNPSRTVIGTHSKAVFEKVKRLYKSILPKDQKYFLVTPTEAEIVKYMSNLLLASQIILANEYFFLAKKMGANYDRIKESVLADERIGRFLNVPGWDGDFGFGHACFPKDMVGLLDFTRRKKIDMSVLEEIWKKNLKVRKVREWEKMENAFGRDSGKKKGK